MSGVLRIDEKYQLCIMSCPVNHGISGHIYEIIDYYLLLKEYYNICLIISDNIQRHTLSDIINSKYNITEEELEILLSNTIFHKNPNIIICSNVLIVDGYYDSVNLVVRAKNIFMFSCPLDNAYSSRDNHYILHDYRIYKEGKNTINYKKKIYLDRLKSIETTENNILLYGTKNCREIKNIDEIVNYVDGKIICITDIPMIDTEDVIYKYPPVDNLFELFDTYIYTPVSIKFDCSPRFIVECKYYNKNVIYYNIDYDDIGLYWRRYDIDNDFQSLFLTKDDDIIDIIGDKIG